MVKKHYLKELRLNKELKRGHKGKEVKKVQEWINLWRHQEPLQLFRVVVDGIFGFQTESAIKAFQSLHLFETTGIVDQQTFQRLTSPMRQAFAPIVRNTLNDLIVSYAEQHLKNFPRELNNRNEGPWVRAYMDGHEGAEWAWCVGFVQTVLDQAFDTMNASFKLIQPHTYSCDILGKHGLDQGVLVRNKDLKKDISSVRPGDVFLVVRTKFDWVHTGIITRIDGDWIHTIEGNTNDEGVREGFEVCRRMRNIRKTNIDVFLTRVKPRFSHMFADTGETMATDFGS